MWSIKEVKKKGLGALKGNYWKSVLVAGIFSLAMGGVVGSKYNISFSEGFADGLSAADQNQDMYMQGMPMVAAIAMGILAFVAILFVILALAVLLDILIVNPAEMGVRRFFLRNQSEKAKVGEVMYAFDNNWKNVIGVMFFYDLYIFLWSLLLVVPGIVKAYEYRMLPYIVAENSQISREEAFALSKKMMHGQKWKTFVLDISFVGWHFLGGLTLGILDIFYVAPYKRNVDAALYETLKNM